MQGQKTHTLESGINVPTCLSIFWKKSTQDILIPDPLFITFEASVSRYMRTHDFDFVYKVEATFLEGIVLKSHNLKTLRKSMLQLRS